MSSGSAPTVFECYDLDTPCIVFFDDTGTLVQGSKIAHVQQHAIFNESILQRIGNGVVLMCNTGPRGPGKESFAIYYRDVKLVRVAPGQSNYADNLRSIRLYISGYPYLSKYGYDADMTVATAFVTTHQALFLGPIECGQLLDLHRAAISRHDS